MFIASLITAWLALLVFAAHVLRTGHLLLVAMVLAVMGLMLVKRRWAQLVVQAVLCLAALEWLRTTWVLMQERLANDEPWRRMAIILTSVAAFTILSAMLAYFGGRKACATAVAHEPQT
jgi:hypothetical protein